MNIIKAFFTKINWKVRFKSKTFWLAMVSACILLAQAVARLLGFELELGELENNLIGVVNAVFGVLVILGVAVDPTTKGVADSKRALEYTEPR